MKRLRAIFFDIDDTLYATSTFAKRARRAAIEAMIQLGLQGDADALYQELTEVIHEFSANFGHHFDKLLLRLPPSTYAGVNPALIIATGVVAYHETKFRELAPFPGVVDLMKALRSSGLIRGVITHGATIKQAEKIIRLKIHTYLTPEAIFISDQIGVAKPNVKIYQRALEAMNVAPHESMYVGDNPVTDVDPPNALGMLTVRFRWPGKYGHMEGETSPDFEITAFDQLFSILRNDLGVLLEAP